MNTPLLRSTIVRRLCGAPSRRQCPGMPINSSTIRTVRQSSPRVLSLVTHLSSPTRHYHSSPVTELPVRRRRVPNGHSTTMNNTNNTNNTTNKNDDDTEELRHRSPLKHASIDDDVEFVHAATALLDKLELALEPMKAMNDFFEVERFFGEFGEVLTIDLGPKEGKYRVEMSLDDHVFEYTSPISGKVLYVLSAETGEWVGMDDGHSFVGLLVRDLIRQCRGLPNL